MTNPQRKEHSRCLEYAQQHTIMLLMLLLFFGVLSVPRFYEQVRQSRHEKIEGVVRTVYFSQSDPILSFVEITYQVDKKDYNAKELLHQHIRVGDHVDIYVGTDRKEILFMKPNPILPSMLLVAYAIILSLCVYKSVGFFFKKQQKQ